MDKAERINAYLNICRPAPYGFVGPTHWHREINGAMKSYLGQTCSSAARTRPMEVRLEDFFKSDG